jgi:hypothetical protein
MSRFARSVLMTAICGGTLAVWLLARPSGAHAQGGPAVANGSHYQLSALPSGGWLVLDTQTGTFELWNYSPQGPSYRVQRADFGGTTLTTRVVPAPRPTP